MLSAVLGVGDFIKTFRPLSNFHLLKPKALFGCHLQYCVFQKSFWQLILKRFCWKEKKKGKLCSIPFGRVSLTLCIIINKIASLYKPHSPSVIFKTFQFGLPKAVIFKHDFETLWGFPSYLKGGMAKNSQNKINFIFKKQHECHISFGGFRRVIVDVRVLNT